LDFSILIETDTNKLHKVIFEKYFQSQATLNQLSSELFPESENIYMNTNHHTIQINPEKLLLLLMLHSLINVETNLLYLFSRM